MIDSPKDVISKLWTMTCSGKTTESITKCLRLEGTSGSIIGAHMEEKPGVIASSVGKTLAVSPQHLKSKPLTSSKFP